MAGSGQATTTRARDQTAEAAQQTQIAHWLFGDNPPIYQGMAVGFEEIVLLAWYPQGLKTGDTAVKAQPELVHLPLAMLRGFGANVSVLRQGQAIRPAATGAATS